MDSQTLWYACMMRQTWLIVLALAPGFVACASFKGTDAVGGTDDGRMDAKPGSGGEGGACITPTSCPPDTPSCKYYDFSSATCPQDWKPGGDVGMSGVVYECGAGNLHVAAKGTLDVDGDLSVPIPSADTKTIFVSANLTIKTWIASSIATKLPILQLSNGVSRVIVYGDMNVDANVRFTTCPMVGDCSSTFVSVPDKTHLFQFELTATGVSIAVDCAHAFSLPAFPVDSAQAFHVVFGTVDGEPIDGTIDDVRVSFGK